VFVTHQPAATKLQEGVKMKVNATRLIRTFMILTMGFLVLSQLFLHSADNAYSQVMSTIDRTRFRPSTKEQGVSKLQGEAYDFVLATGYQYFERQA